METKQCEGFDLMLYKCEKCLTIEVLWNSRDAVTPFCINCIQCDGMMQHAHWQLDVKKPDFKPPKGTRIFVTLTQKRCEELTRQRVDRMWDTGKYPMKEGWNTKEEAVIALSRDRQPDEPAVEIVK